ncbi:MAG: hypothetical protein IE916_03710 [Epsilonproteobacteria bacterium]|nr:hypothetical protein [Campylobacterota bacterium]
MKSRTCWRGGFGFTEIMALLLVVLPTIAFIITLLIDYWAVMRIDNNLKIIVHLASTKMDNMSDLSASPSDAALEKELSSYCPEGKKVTFAGARSGDGPMSGGIKVSASYRYSGSYLKDKEMLSSMVSYSYHDQNATIELVCN